MQGLNNLDVICYDYFGDVLVMFEVFKVGEIDLWCEFVVLCWDSNFDFFVMCDGCMVKFEIEDYCFLGI